MISFAGGELVVLLDLPEKPIIPSCTSSGALVNGIYHSGSPQIKRTPMNCTTINRHHVFRLEHIMKKILFMMLIGCSLSLLNGCSTPLIDAAFRGDVNTAKELIDNGADVNESSGPDRSDALSTACFAGHIEVVRLLLAKGANLEKTHAMGVTPLSAAAWNGNAEIVNLLLEKGANVSNAISGLRSYFGTQSAIDLIVQIQKERTLKQPVSAVVSTSHQPSTLSVKSDIDEIPVAKTTSNKKAYAIVIGIEQYRQKLPKADFAVSDATLVSKYLVNVLGYPEENVVLLTNDKALQSDLSKYIEKWLPNNVEPDSNVFVYYSGHGAPNPATGDAYLVPYDGDPSFIDETGYSLSRLYSALGKLRAQKVVVALDSCFSGAGGRSVIAKGARSLVAKMKIPLASHNITVLSASSETQMSSTYDEKGHGLFTYFMLKGLKNEEVINQNGSLRIEELYNYIKPQVELVARKKYNNEQVPQLVESFQH